MFKKQVFPDWKANRKKNGKGEEERKKNRSTVFVRGTTNIKYFDWFYASNFSLSLFLSKFSLIFSITSPIGSSPSPNFFQSSSILLLLSSIHSFIHFFPSYKLYTSKPTAATTTRRVKEAKNFKLNFFVFQASIYSTNCCRFFFFLQ